MANILASRLQFFLGRWSYRARNRLQDFWNQIADTQNYVRFLVVGRSRTGTNFLRGLLNTHPQVVLYGEVFQNPDSMEWDHSGHFQTQEMQTIFRNEPIRLLQKGIYRHYPAAIGAVGFKIFYYHARRGAWQEVWPFLLSNQEIRVIHMRRRNILKTHLSWKRATKNGCWVSARENSVSEPPIYLDYQECLSIFERTRQQELAFDHDFKNHPKLELYYEDFVRNLQQEIVQVQEFLGVAAISLMSTTQRQSSLPLSTAISNYFELKDRFAGTEWAQFFVD